MQINIARKAANRIPLTRNAALDKSAKSHAKYVASVGDLNAGGDPDGSLKERIEKWIKNPLVMFEFSANWASSVTEMTNAIMDHQKHRDIVLSDSNLIGIGVVDNFWTFQIVKDALKEDQ
ncbi:hypothetical protein IWQ56_002718 [Coemansia nantahalensis]|nr:hypothetical protein IWQ56_002718 [Coemansia nantahalensis]